MNKAILLITTFLIAITAAMALPDLAVSNVSISQVDPAIAGSYALVMIDFANTGNESASNVNYEVRFDTGAPINRVIPVFADHSSTRHNVQVMYNVSGAHNVTVTIDSTNTIAEDSESNNAFTLDFNVAAPALNASMGAVSVSGAKGATASSTFTVTNTGNDEMTASFASSQLSGSSTISSSAMSFTPSSTTLAIGQSKTIKVDVVIPSGVSDGTYTGTLTASFAGSSVTSGMTLNVLPPTTSFSTTGNVTMKGAWNDAVSDTFTVTNTGTDDVMINLSKTSITGLSVSFDADTFSLGAGASRNVVVSSTIPSEADAKTYTGTITVKGANLTKTVPFSIEVEGKLDFYSVKMSKNNDSFSTLNDGDNEKVSPGDELNFKVVVENLFTDSEDVDMNSIDVTVEVNGKDWEEDDSASVGKLAAEEKNSASDEVAELSLTVDDSVNDGDEYTLLITAAGTDDNDIEHEKVMTVILKVEKDNYDLSFARFSISPSTLSCGDNSVDIDVELKNKGSEDLSNIQLDITSSLLGIKVSEDNIDIDSEDNWEKTLKAVVDLNRSGEYTITAKADNSHVTEYTTATLNIEACSSGSTTTTTTPSQTTTTPSGVRLVGSANSGAIGTGGASVAESDNGSFGDAAIITLLVVGIFAFIGLGIFLVVKFW